jgi:hypothetical protein
LEHEAFGVPCTGSQVRSVFWGWAVGAPVFPGFPSFDVFFDGDADLVGVDLVAFFDRRFRVGSQGFSDGIGAYAEAFCDVDVLYTFRMDLADLFDQFLGERRLTFDVGTIPWGSARGRS